MLPLTNESGDKDQQYFSDGLSEDLITALSQFDGLKVISRNSSFQFRDSKDDSSVIGAKLGVAHLLEGSVRRAGDDVRISAELVNVANGIALWSQHYDRPYKDLFRLQDDITNAVAGELKTKLLTAAGADGPEASSTSQRRNLAGTEDAFQQGQFYFARGNGADSRAIDSFQTAIGLDPRYARAYASLAIAQVFLADSMTGDQAQQTFAMARNAANTASTLDPNLAAAHASRALVLLFIDVDVVGTEAEFRRAVELDPNDPNLRASLAQARAALGHPEAAIEPIRQAIAADPWSPNWYSLLEGDLMAVGRLDEAEQAVRKESELQPDKPCLKARLSAIEVLRGQAAPALDLAMQTPPGKCHDLAFANAQQIGTDGPATDAALKSLIDRYAKTDAYFIARTFALRKDPDQMFAWLDRARANHDNNISILYYDPFLLRYKGDPRFAAYCTRGWAADSCGSRGGCDVCCQRRERLQRSIAFGADTMSKPSFFAELKRRNVIRMAGLYLIGAWLITQVSSTVLPMFGAPDWLPRTIVLLLLIGFVPTLIFSWIYELTPEGIKRDAEVPREQSIAPQTGRRIDRTIIAALVIALVYFAADKFVLAPQRDAQKHASSAPATAVEKVAAAASTGSATTPPPAAAIPEKSIAVLPFENLSDEKANAYFATGMQDEILTRLAGIRDLKVISRTSTRKQYASHPPNLKIVAEQLGVATLLEGSVQRADGRVRINLQLIDARSDSHLWAQNYDRDLKDVFAVQSDVSEKVADALKAQLLPAESTRIARVPTNNPEAYDRFLRAEYFARQFESTSVKNPFETERKAAELYASAIEADPMFALAYAQLAYVKGYAFWRGEDHDPQALEAAREGAQKALALQPDLAEAHLAMGAVHYWSHRDYAAALTEFATARASLPNDARVLAAIAFAHGGGSKLLQAVAELEQAAVLDPRDSGQPRDLADTFIYLRRYTEAAAASNRSLALAPDNVQSYVYRAAALQMRGDPEGANRSLAGLSADYDSEGSVSLRRFNLALWMGQPDAALLAIENAPSWLLDVVNNVPIPVTMLRGQALAAKGESGPARTAFLEAQESLRTQPHESRGAMAYKSISLPFTPGSDKTTRRWQPLDAASN